MAQPTLILGQFLIADAEQKPLPDAGVAVSGAHIVGTGPNEDLLRRYPDAAVVDKRDCALAPGFVNTHHHMYGVLAHGIPLQRAPAGFWPFLEEFWWPLVEDALTHDLIAAATDWACYEMTNNGITAFYDCLEAPNAIPGALDVEAAIVERWGLRGTLSFEATERKGAANRLEGLRENARFIRDRKGRNPLVQGMMCFHTTFTCSPSFIRRAFDLARELGTRIHMHVSEGTYEPEFCLRTYGKRTVEVYDDWGVLNPAVLASQCVQISPREIELLAQSGVAVSHMPLSNCEVGGGFSPVPEMLAQGVLVALGTDGYVNDFFEVMRGAFLMHKARLLDPTTMPAPAIWKMATENGARALGLGRVGQLEPGWAADLIAIRTDLPTPAAPHNLLDQLLLWRSAKDVSDVMVAGEWLKRDGKVLRGDDASIRARCQEAAQRLWERASG
ncbi:MAG: amidohydrolase family protein [Anaerolineales bacterium]